MSASAAGARQHPRTASASTARTDSTSIVNNPSPERLLGNANANLNAGTGPGASVANSPANVLSSADEHGAAQMFAQCRFRLILPVNESVTNKEPGQGQQQAEHKARQQAQPHTQTQPQPQRVTDASLEAALVSADTDAFSPAAQSASFERLMNGVNRRTLVQGEMLRAYLVILTPLSQHHFSKARNGKSRSTEKAKTTAPARTQADTGSTSSAPAADVTAMTEVPTATNAGFGDDGTSDTDDADAVIPSRASNNIFGEEEGAPNRAHGRHTRQFSDTSDLASGNETIPSETDTAASAADSDPDALGDDDRLLEVKIGDDEENDGDFLDEDERDNGANHAVLTEDDCATSDAAESDRGETRSDQLAEEQPSAHQHTADDTVEIDDSNVWAAYARLSASAFSADDLAYFRRVFSRVRIELDLLHDSVLLNQPGSDSDHRQHANIVQRQPRHVSAGLDVPDVVESRLAHLRLSKFERRKPLQDRGVLSPATPSVAASDDGADGDDKDEWEEERTELYEAGRPAMHIPALATTSMTDIEDTTATPSSSNLTALSANSVNYIPLRFAEHAGMFVYEILMPVSVKDRYLDMDLSLRCRVIAASIAERRNLSLISELTRVVSPSFVPLRAVSRTCVKQVRVTKPLRVTFLHCWLSSDSERAGLRPAELTNGVPGLKTDIVRGSTAGSNIIHVQVQNRFGARILILQSVDVQLKLPPPSFARAPSKLRGKTRENAAGRAASEALEQARAALELVSLRDYFKVSMPATTTLPVMIAPGESHALLLTIDPQLHSQSTPVKPFPFLGAAAGGISFPPSKAGTETTIATGLSQITAQVVLTWSTPRIFGSIRSTFMVRLACPETQDVAIDLMVTPSDDSQAASGSETHLTLDPATRPVVLGNKFRVSVAVANVGDVKRDFTLIVDEHHFADELNDSYEGAKVGNGSSSVAAAESASRDKRASRRNIGLAAPQNTVAPILCLDKSVHVGELGPKSVTRASVAFRAVREGVWHLPRMQLYDSLTRTRFEMPGEPCHVVVVGVRANA